MIIFTNTEERAKEIFDELAERYKDFDNAKAMTISKIIEFESLGVKNRIKIVSPKENARSLKDNIVLYDGSIYDYEVEHFNHIRRAVINTHNIQNPSLLYPYSYFDTIVNETLSLRYTGEE